MYMRKNKINVIVYNIRLRQTIVEGIIILFYILKNYVMTYFRRFKKIFVVTYESQNMKCKKKYLSKNFFINEKKDIQDVKTYIYRVFYYIIVTVIF